VARLDLRIEEPWTQAQTECLHAMWMAATEDGRWQYTVTQIGAQLGRSRNSVIGRLRRTGAPGRVNPVTRAAVTPKAAVAPPEPAPVVIRLPRPPRTEIVTILRSIDPCQWLDGDDRPYTQCQGARRPGSPYCAGHHRVAYRPLPGKLKLEAIP
jgi:hypothetical protein